MTGGLAASGPLKRGDLILDKYEVRGLLGKGGHAFVYDCFNAFLAEEVAIKLIPNPEHRGNQLFKRARGEAQVLYRLNHPNVVRVMDGGELDGMAYIVMEKLNGISLRQLLIQRRTLPVIEALLIALQVAEALEAAHAMNVIHRDLKPDNIFLLPENHVKVLDFGIAKFLDGYQTTQRDLIQGTAPYMSPEHVQGLGVTFASDIFQLGTVIYEMIAGVCPCMVGIEEVTLQELVAIQIAKLPPRLKQLVRGVPDYVDRLVWRAIAKQAQQRFATMPEFTDAIRNALQRLGVDLPSERMHRANAQRRSSSRPPKPDAEFDPGAVRSTPFALSTPQLASRPSAKFREKTEPMPDGPPPSEPPSTFAKARVAPRSLRPPPPALEPRAKPRETPPPAVSSSSSTRFVLLRAALIGALIAVPVGLVFGLARRRTAPIVQLSSVSSSVALKALPGAAPPAAAAAPTPTPRTSSADVAVAPVVEPITTSAPPRPVPSSATVMAKPAMRPPAVQVASGLTQPQPRAAATPSATNSAKPSVVPLRVPPTSIF